MAPGSRHIRGKLHAALGLFRLDLPAALEPVQAQRRDVLEADAHCALSPADPKVRRPGHIGDVISLSLVASSSPLQVSWGCYGT